MKDIILNAFSDRHQPTKLPEWLHPNHTNYEEIQLLMSYTWENLTDSIIKKIVFCWGSFDCDFVNYYLPGIMLFVLERSSSSSMIVDDIISDLLQQKDMNGLGYEFTQRWGGLSIEELEVFELWLDTIKKSYSEYDFDQVHSVILKLKKNAVGEQVSKPILL